MIRNCRFIMSVPNQSTSSFSAARPPSSSSTRCARLHCAADSFRRDPHCVRVRSHELHVTALGSMSSSSSIDTVSTGALCCGVCGTTTKCAISPISVDRFGIFCARQPTQRQTMSFHRCARKRRIRASNRTWMTATVTITTAAVVAAAALAVVSSPIPMLPSCEAFSAPHVIATSISTRLHVDSLNAVRKRSGNHDVSATRIKNAVTSKPLTSTPSPQQKLEQHQQQRKQSLVQIQMKRQQQRPKRSRNVFEQFTPEYAKSPFDVDVLPKYSDSDKPETPTLNVDHTSIPANSKQQKHLSQRLQSLLQNDEGEQDYFADDSPEAARQVADIRIYGKLSEEARRKATEAVKEVKDTRRRGGAAGANDSKRGQLQEELVVSAAATASRKKRTSTIRATVKETGSDSISTYIKSLGQHELLYKADEILLGRQVRLLMNLESSRKGLEEKLLR